MSNVESSQPDRHSGQTERDTSLQKCQKRKALAVMATLTGLGIGVGFLAQSCRRPELEVPTVDDWGRYDSALISMIKQHVSAACEAPNDARVRATLGLVYEANKIWSPACECYKQATFLDPSEPMWPHHAAITWLETGDVEGATNWLQSYAARFGSFAPLQHRLGIVLLNAGKIAEAEAAFRKVIALVPSTPAGFVGVGEAAMENGDHVEAMRSLEHALKMDPTDKTARYLLGRAYRAMGRMEDALRELTLGKGGTRRHLNDPWSNQLTKYNLSIGSRQLRAVTLVKAGKPAEAAEVLENILASDPDNLEALVNLGNAYQYMGRLDEALFTLERAQQLDPNRFETYINLAACYRRMKRPSDALTYADKAVALAPEVAQSYHARGLTLMQLGSNQQALVSLTKAADRDPNSPRILQDLANTFARLRRYDEALEKYETLASMLPTRWEPLLGIAQMNLQLGRLDAASTAVGTALELEPSQPRLLALAARIMEMQNP